MKIEVKEGLWIEGYHDKLLFQNEVIRIILSDEKWNIYYIGLTTDIDKREKHRVFKKENGIKSITKWKELMNNLENPEYIICMWKRKTNKCVNVEYKPKFRRKTNSIYVGEESNNNN